MARPKICRCVELAPNATYFKPRGIPMRDLQEAVLAVEELEALRLADMEGLTASLAAERMGISRHTFGRTLAAARATVARALVQGLALRIEGGTYRMLTNSTCRPDIPQMTKEVETNGPEDSLLPERPLSNREE